MKRVLYILPHRLNRSPSQRFRIEQFLPYLKENGFDYYISNLLNEKNDRHFYSNGKLIYKFWLMFRFIFHRIGDLFRLGRYDLIFIQREALFIGTSVFEYFMGRSKVPVIFDFDDSIWIRDVSQGNRKLGWLKRPSKTAKIISYADMVFAGNSYLASYAANNNKNVIVIPTTIDTSYHKNTRQSEKTSGRVCIGWTGTETTIKHYETILPVLKRLKEKYKDRVWMKVIADISFSGNGLEIYSEIWKLETEIESLMEFDIGIMPLPDDQWSKGKCGLKGLQYMALEIPVVLSGVGINTEIICDGKNGFLANTDEEWVERLSLLIENAGLRKTMGSEGRKTVIDFYSIESQKEKYLSCFRQLTERDG